MRGEERLGQRQNKHYDEQWNARFEELLSYRSEHGDCNVPQMQGKLGSWVRVQRRAYMADSLAQVRIDRLNSMGFKWALKEKGPLVPWETRFKELVQYKTIHGDCNVPQKHGKLGTWVNKQRLAYKTGSIAQYRIDRLDSIGFKWAMNAPRVPWEARFNELVQYKANHGDCNIPAKQGQLGKWVDTQRTNYKKDKLSQDRFDRLNGIGFGWALPRGGSRKGKAPPGTRNQSLSRRERVSPPSTNVSSPSVGDGARGVESNGFKGEGHNATSALSLESPSRRSDQNRGTECDEEDDEIGALIYVQIMRQKQTLTASQAGRRAYQDRRKRD